MGKAIKVTLLYIEPHVPWCLAVVRGYYRVRMSAFILTSWHRGYRDSLLRAQLGQQDAGKDLAPRYEDFSFTTCIRDPWLEWEFIYLGQGGCFNLDCVCDCLHQALDGSRITKACSQIQGYGMTGISRRIRPACRCY